MLDFYPELSIPNPFMVSVNRMYFYFVHGVTKRTESVLQCCIDALREGYCHLVFG